jgi:hypothetical protein
MGDTVQNRGEGPARTLTRPLLPAPPGGLSDLFRSGMPLGEAWSERVKARRKLESKSGLVAI